MRGSTRRKILLNRAMRPLRHYADFEGRSRRSEFWLFHLTVIGLAAAIGVACALAGVLVRGDAGRGIYSTGYRYGPGLIGLTVLYFAILLPSLAVQVRRFHDQDKSGWFILLNAIPYVGGLAVVVFMCLEGTQGTNRFGSDPKRRRTSRVQ